MNNQIIIINGPNLNLLGRREVELYGKRSFESYFDQLLLEYPDLELFYYQSNHEGNIIDALHKRGFSSRGIVLNAGAYTHTSIAIADAVKAISSPVIEVHITDVSKREKYRQHSYLSPVCAHHIMGLGLEGYKKAIDFILANY